AHSIATPPCLRSKKQHSRRLTPLYRFVLMTRVTIWENRFMAPEVRVGLLSASLSLRGMTAGRWLAFTCAALLICIFGTAGIAAETYPSRPIRLLIGFPPGGPADIPGRAIAERLSQSLGVPVVPENKAGAGGMLAMQELIAQPADGHTLLICTYFD